MTRESIMMKARNVFILILTLVFLVIFLQNTEVVSLQILFWQFSMSRIIFFPLMVFIGFVVGFFVGRKSWDW